MKKQPTITVLEETGKAGFKSEEEIREDERCKVEKWLMKQMEKGKAAEKYALTIKKKLPRKILDILEKKRLTNKRITIARDDVENLFYLARVGGIANFVLLELYLSAKEELGIDLKIKKVREC